MILANKLRGNMFTKVCTWSLDTAKIYDETKTCASKRYRYADNNAIVIWSFGNELNGPWNGFIQQLSEAHQCGVCFTSHLYLRNESEPVYK